MYTVIISRQALKELTRLPQKINQQITQAIDRLGADPRPPGCKKMKGEHEYMWRIRVGDYRVLYDINDQVQVIDIRKVGHRKDIYR